MNNNNEKIEKVKKSKKSRIEHGTKLSKGCWMCDICGYEGRDRTTIKIHIKSHSNNHKYTCTRCCYTFKNAKSLNNHIAIAHFSSSNDKETEEDCSQNRNEPEKWDNSTLIYVDIGIEEDSETEKSISPEPNNDIKPVTVRILNYNLTDTGEHVCPECGVVIKNRKHFTRHWNKHIGVKFRCDHCGADFSRRDKLQEHVREKHEGSNDKPEASPISTGESNCDKSFTDEEN